jgi:hypothetical protein
MQGGVPLCGPCVAVLQQSVLPLNVSIQQQLVLVLPLDVSVLQQPVLALYVSVVLPPTMPLDMSVLVACAVSGLQKFLMHLNTSV